MKTLNTIVPATGSISGTTMSAESGEMEDMYQDAIKPMNHSVMKGLRRKRVVYA